jgi:hypothetical protein
MIKARYRFPKGSFKMLASLWSRVSLRAYESFSVLLQGFALLSSLIGKDFASLGKFGWGGRIRTFTIHINSVVSYRLDHAPAALVPDLRPERTR